MSKKCVDIMSRHLEISPDAYYPTSVTHRQTHTLKILMVTGCYHEPRPVCVTPWVWCRHECWINACTHTDWTLQRILDWFLPVWMCVHGQRTGGDGKGGVSVGLWSMYGFDVCTANLRRSLMRFLTRLVDVFSAVLVLLSAALFL